MGLYDDLQTVAQDVLGEFKQGVIEYGTIADGAGDADEPGGGRLAWVVLDGAVARGVEYRYIADGLASASDKQVTMAVQSDVTPRLKDTIKIDDIRYKITQVIAKPAAGTPVAYTLILGR